MDLEMNCYNCGSTECSQYCFPQKEEKNDRESLQSTTERTR